LDAIDVGLEDVIHFEGVAERISEFLLGLPRVVFQEDFLEELIDSFSRSAYSLLVRILSLSYAGQNLNEFVACVQARVQSGDGVRVIIRSNVLRVDHRRFKHALALRVRELYAVAQGAKVN